MTTGVLITGASTGIGRACALRLDRGGFRVFAGVRNPEDGARLKQMASPTLMPVRIDVTDMASIVAAARTVEAATCGEGLAGLVNNAGVVLSGPLEYLAIENLRRQFEVNVVGPIAVTQAFLPMLRTGRGRVVNMGSSGGRMALPFVGPYTASKFALEALTDSLRIELRPWNIPVIIIEPGSVATPIWEKSRQSPDRSGVARPAGLRDLYGATVQSFSTAMQQVGKAGLSSDIVAATVERALTARRPKTRYLVGSDAWLQAALGKFVPDRLRDAILVRKYGIRSNPR